MAQARRARRVPTHPLERGARPRHGSRPAIREPGDASVRRGGGRQAGILRTLKGRDPIASQDATSDYAETAPATARPGARAEVARLRHLAIHLAKRELDATHRMTTLGWAWPLVRQLAQLGVLVFVFSHVLTLDIENYPVFVFTGLIAWTWFAAGVSSASVSLIKQRHLLFQARFPAVVLPIVALVVPLLDVLLAVPVLLLMVAVSQGLPWTVVLTPIVVLMQFVLMAGLAWIAAAMSVFLRDIPNLVGVALMLLFYLTPVFYGVRSLPAEFERLLHINPLTTVVETYRAVLLGQEAPGAARLAGLGVFSIAVAAVGFLGFRRVQHRFVDYL
jgi:lipopolysaccharide transport system permease protein